MPSATAPVRRRTRELESLAGLSAIDAITRLRALELRPAVEPCESGPDARGRVLAHEPAAGADVCRGQLITLLVGEQLAHEGSDAARHEAPGSESGQCAAPRPPCEIRPFTPRLNVVCEPAATEPRPRPESAPQRRVAAIVEEALSSVAAVATPPACPCSLARAPAAADLAAPSLGDNGPVARGRAVVSEDGVPDAQKRSGRQPRTLVAAAVLLAATPLALLAFALVRADPAGRVGVTVASSASSRLAPHREPGRRAASAVKRAPRRRSTATASVRSAAVSSGASRTGSPPRASAAGDSAHDTRSPAGPLAAPIDQSESAAPAQASPVGLLPGPPPSP